MIYEVEFTSNSRESARNIAKQLMYEHVLASASITPSDYLSLNLSGAVAEVEEQYLVKVKALTIAPKYLMENYKLKNFVAKAASVDEETAKKVASWCNEEAETLEKPAKSWAEYREEVLQMRTDNDTLRELAITGHPGLNLDDIVYRHEQPAHEAPVLNQDDARLQFLRHNGFTMTQEDLEALKVREELTVKNTAELEAANNTAKTMTDILEETTTPVRAVHNYETDEDDLVDTAEELDESEKKHKKLPKWAEKAGLTYSEYKNRMNKRTAARWGLTYQEYSKLAADARKAGVPLKEYFEALNLKYSEDADEIEDFLGKRRVIQTAENAFTYWLQSVGLDESNTIDTVFDSWCTKYELTMNQRAILRCTAKLKNENPSGKTPRWAEKLGLTYEQYKLISRMGTAANWGISLALYDSYYNSAKHNGTTVENELAIKYTKGVDKNAAQRIGAEFRNMMNYIARLQDLYEDDSQ